MRHLARATAVILVMLGSLGVASHALAQELPPGAAHSDVREFGAKGDGVTDDTQAFRDAFANTYSAWEVVYVPPGTYLVSDTIEIGRFLTLRGAGPAQTVIRLADGASGFTDADNPRGVLRAWRGCCNPGGPHDNTTHSVHILNLTVEIGAGSPGAIGIDFIAHNGGGVENVTIRDGGGSAHTGLSLERDANGPSLYNRIRIEGFERGIAIGGGVYGTTFEDVTLIGQREVGLLNNSHPIAMRHLYSENSVPAVRSSSSDYGQLVLLDSLLLGGSPSSAAIESEGSGYVRNVESEGYRATLSQPGGDVIGPIKENFSPALERYRTSPARSLNLPVRDMFVPDLGPASEWANVRAFGSGGDWTSALQAAIDSGARTVYFPSTTHAPYPCSGDVVVRGAVRNIIGLYANLGDGRLVFETEDPSAVIYVEQVRTEGGYVHRSPATVVLRRSMGGSFTTEPATGDALVDDWCCGNFVINGSKLWSRQLNEESYTTKLSVTNGQLWVLGLKTEQSGTVGHFKNGSLAEILGSLLYPAQGAPTSPLYVNEGSAYAAFHREIGSGYPVFSREVHDSSSEDVDPNFTQGTLFTSNLKDAGTSATGDSGLRGNTGGNGGSNAAGGAMGGASSGGSNVAGASSGGASSGGASSGGASSGGAGTLPASGSSGASTSGGSTDSGCGCRAPRSGLPHGALGHLLALALAVAIRRRAGAKHRG